MLARRSLNKSFKQANICVYKAVQSEAFLYGEVVCERVRGPEGLKVKTLKVKTPSFSRGSSGGIHSHGPWPHLAQPILQYLSSSMAVNNSLHNTMFSVPSSLPQRFHMKEREDMEEKRQMEQVKKRESERQESVNRIDWEKSQIKKPCKNDLSKYRYVFF